MKKSTFLSACLALLFVFSFHINAFAADASRVDLRPREDVKSTRVVEVLPGEKLGVYVKNTDNVDGNDMSFYVEGTNIEGDLTYGNQTYNHRFNVRPGKYRLFLVCDDHSNCQGYGILSSRR
ncbi:MULTISPECIES: hypothetical protein [Thermoactinomyces]|jgi:hypothetical protein|uniref:EfeO-type cupredoxin-like domain-containing protein n=1 Tax=Thermoactinomyces daqus TaxID=1329516 RepID=A0A7W2AIH2_9BACL|nr:MULTISPECIES: hypothetical protein [Thermoactinomyces]MBA4544242.1 hypothetical protein [Thermoactinomyces daqus]MBH8597043.1 hypothetical protein [Thermoactinomyces sp. CICC 10523]MBH8603820.1 hypothetical protein [Thermoactinomyces sp. CICC 10522]MBH8608876.1 hypothetical protein [Thermoactinomyces sp. CICC 10521]